MTETLRERISREIEHGEWIDANDPEAVWGWATPAGRCRAIRRARMIQEQSHLRPGVRVMEIGCGSGMFTEMFAASGAHIVALDVSPSLIQRARRRCIRQKNVEFIQSSFEEYDDPQGFDAIIGSSVLHHLELKKALKNIVRLLKPTGHMCFAEPNYLNPQVFLERKLHKVIPFFKYVSSDETAFIRWRLEKQLRQYCFENIRIKPFDWLHPNTPPLWISKVVRTGNLFEKTAILREFSGSVLIYGRKKDC